MQDILGLGSDGRMNIPSSANGNWSWRYKPDALSPELAEKLALITTVADRGGPPEHITDSTEYFVV
jgi:4-alpha-glucanotransferase